MKDPGTLNFVFDHLKTTTMCEHGIKKSPNLLRYVFGQYKTQ